VDRHALGRDGMEGPHVLPTTPVPVTLFTLST
jgi:hypothetical protein